MKRLGHLLFIAAGEGDVVEVSVKLDPRKTTNALAKDWVNEGRKKEPTEDRTLTRSPRALEDAGGGPTVENERARFLIFKAKNGKERCKARLNAPLNDEVLAGKRHGYRRYWLRG